MELEIYNVENFDYRIIKDASLQKRKKGNQGIRLQEKFYYKNLFCAFDIECSNDLELEQAFMYIWQFQIEDYTIIGRTWDEFLSFMQNVRDQLEDNEKLIVYVHNLSYEFTFMKGIYNFSSDDVFATDVRKILKCTMHDNIEFRCSYFLTNMNLKTFTKKMGVKEKLSGDDFDYSIMRYPWTELSDMELDYCITDVKSLVDALKVYFSIEHDNFYSIPLTSTGFVRRDVRSAMRHYNKADLKEQLPDYNIFKLLRYAFRGGNTHANRYYVGDIIDNVVSYDRVSSYPDVQINELFPMSAWIHEPDADIERVVRKIYKQGRACLMHVRFYNIYLADPLDGCPYIAKHKCIVIGDHENDNGRILYASYLELALTDIDFKIINEQYKFDDCMILDFYHARYGKLPKPLRDEIKKYFNDKTQLKNVKGQELFYQLQKGKLNSIYGMCVQSPVKQNIIYNDGLFKVARDVESEILEKTNKKAFLTYAWGVWTTARAREQLQIAINKVGELFIYADTDSVKFVKDPSVDFDSYNKARMFVSESNGGVAIDPSGVKQYLGLYENEGTYKHFITLGAKKYGYIDQEDNLHITIAGVGKSKGAIELSKRGGLKSFKEGFVFYDAGGTESVYNDFPDAVIEKDGYKLKITSNVLIRRSTYTLGVTGEYKRILDNPAIWLDLIKD